MTKTVSALALVCALAQTATAQAPNEIARWEQQAQNITITRDDWGTAHIRGRTDADAVFGLMYAQAEDDFNRVETNYLNSQGRLAEAEGIEQVYRDLRMKLFINPDSMKAMYARSPQWLQALMDAYADGLNFFLFKHPEVKPRVITRFEPWMALTFSEGSIGGDIERVNLAQLEAFYGKQPAPSPGREGTQPAASRSGGLDSLPAEPRGSNGIAIAPSNSASGNALLLINPHTSFFFRSEVQVTSDEGLNAYGAVTWGQFFIYQGFNERAGWMHTSSGVDNIDEFAEKVEKRGNAFCYRYGKDCRPLQQREVTVRYRAADGTLASKNFTTWRTHHGPIVRED